MNARAAIASVLIAAAMTLATLVILLFYTSMWLSAQLMRMLFWPSRILHKRN